MAYDQSSIHYTDPGTQVPPHNDHFESQAYRQGERPDAHQGSTMPDPNRYAPTNKVDEAVTSAFHHAGAETQNYASPELIAQITQNVIKQLQSSGLDGTTPVPPQPHFSTPPPPIQQPVPLSPSTASGASTNMPNRVYTPPSPQKHPDYPTHPSPESHTRYMPDGPQSPTQSKAAQSVFSPPRRSSSPHSQASDAAAEKPVRPKGPSRLSTSKEETTLERIWAQLFDEEGHPTVRLGQFLRGLAVHIIEDYEPQNSIVITPNKMQKYYEEVKLASELYPWSIIFDDERSSISRMYRDLACQHHLVQEKFDERPDIPGLTPVGFERWATLLIQAHPDEEFERLQKAVLEMPISNPDDKKERFPKEISRRLFPRLGDDKVRDRIEESIQEHAAVEIPRRTSREEPKPQQDSHTPRSSVSEPPPPNVPQNHRPSVSFEVPPTINSSASAYIPSHLERERKPYSNIPAECAVDDTNPPMISPAANPIERERKPYSAMPGGGKQYEDENKRDNIKPRSDSSAPKPSRADSTARTRPIIVPQSHPMEVPKSGIQNHHRAPSNAGRRRRSPSFSRGSSTFRQSDSDLSRYPPSSYQPPSSLPPSGPPPFEGIYDEADTRRHFEKSARERVERERARKQAEEESRMYGDSPRRYDRAGLDDRPPARRNDYQTEEDYYRAGGRGGASGYDNFQPYSGPVYR